MEAHARACSLELLSRHLAFREVVRVGALKELPQARGPLICLEDFIPSSLPFDPSFPLGSEPAGEESTNSFFFWIETFVG